MAATTKVTFTLNADTVARINLAAQRLSKPKSQVVREAIQQYESRAGKLSEQVRSRLLRILDEIEAQPPSRPQHEVTRELRELRAARRRRGRRTPVD